MTIDRKTARINRRIRGYRLAGICLLAALPAAGETSVLARIENLEPGDVEVRGFELAGEQEIRIEALALAPHERDHKGFKLADAWILNARSRAVVWSLREARSRRRGSDLREVDEQLRLGAGTYEAFYATFPASFSKDDGGWWESAARSLARMFGWDDERGYEQAVGELSLLIRGDGKVLSEAAVAAGRTELLAGALVSVPARSDNLAQSSGFVLERPMELLLYAVGELDPERGYDHGWIIDAKTRERVWQLTWESSQAAGGAKKNRVAYDRVKLPAGTFAAYFVTDGSHSPQRWNALPPRDPAFWGLTLWPTDPRQKRFVKRYDYRDVPDDRLIIAELTRLSDDEHRSRGFTLTQPMSLRIYAVGEGRSHEMADYGWIVDARTRRKVWAMDYERTEHAGGGSKNRVADEIVRLEAGSYIVSFVTDGSHAYRDWNTAPPTHPERWGITIFGEEGFDRRAVLEYREEDDPAVLARISRVKSHSHRSLEFSLERAAEVSVYALGEGLHGEMYDYGWIEDAAGRRVWEMTYPATAAAGGAAKNRRFQGTLKLPAGDYALHYRTDGSHAYRDWNAPPPNDPDGWGVQVAVVP